METARKNVTEISEFAHLRNKSGGVGRGPLDECREMSVLRLTGTLDESLQQLAVQLFPMVEKAVGAEIYRLYTEAMELARDRGDGIAAEFRDQFLRRFNRECRRESDRGRDSGPAFELKLLEPDDLEESLASETLSNAIFNACSEELFGLDKRMGMLVNDPDLRLGDNPLGPEVIGAAIMAALEGQESTIKARLLLVSLLSRHLPERIRAIYQDINRKLVERNVLPTIRVGMRRHGQAAAGAGQGEGTGAGQGGGADLYSVLQQLISGGVPGQIAGAPAMPGGAPAVPGMAANRPGTFMHALNQLQHGHTDNLALLGFDLAALANGQVNVLRGLRGSGVASMMGPMDTMTLDIVAMVFDYILDDDRIPDAIKALIGRLQIPMLKVAMLDKSFFSQKHHPARRLLDGLAEAAIGWDASEGHEGGLYRKIDQLVTDVLEHFDDSIDVFDAALAGLRAFVAEEKHAADMTAARSAQVIKSREAADLGRRRAVEEVNSALIGHPVPGVIRGFLGEHWVNLLAGLQQKVGSDSPVWAGAVATMTDLIWSVGPKTDAAQRKQLVALLPSLLKRLDEGVQYLGIAAAERDRFFAGLVKCHAEAVRSGLLDQGGEASDKAIAAVDDIPVLDQPADFEPIEPIAESEATDPELVDELDAVMPAVFETEAPLQTEALAPEWGEADARQPAPDSELYRMRRGSWIAYRLDDGVEVRAKLSWISPLRGIYLFTNRQGQRAMSIKADGLEAKLRSGEVRMIDAAPLMERAVDSLMERLQRNAA